MRARPLLHPVCPAQTINLFWSFRSPKPQPTCGLTKLPLELLRMIEACAAKADMRTLGATCKLFHAKWSVVGDWPTRVCANELGRRHTQRYEILLMRLEDVKPGRIGYNPFYIHRAVIVAGRLALHCVELDADDFARRGGRPWFSRPGWFARVTGTLGGTGTHQPFMFELDWDTSRAKITRATTDWIHAALPCPVCANAGKVSARAWEVVRWYPDMKWYDRRHAKIECPLCTRDYSDGGRNRLGLRLTLEKEHPRPVRPSHPR